MPDSRTQAQYAYAYRALHPAPPSASASASAADVDADADSDAPSQKRKRTPTPSSSFKFTSASQRKLSSWILLLSLLLNALLLLPLTLTIVLSRDSGGLAGLFSLESIFGGVGSAPDTYILKDTYPNVDNTHNKDDGDDGDTPPRRCPAPSPLPATPPAPLNLWAPLSHEETAQIAAYLSSYSSSSSSFSSSSSSSSYSSSSSDPLSFNLTPARTASLSDNIIFLIEAYPPPKEAALAYLDQPRFSAHLEEEAAPIPPPERYARVTIHHGAWDVPIVRDYLVGPLPLSAGKASVRRLEEIYHRPDVPFNARGLEMAQMAGVIGFLTREMESIAHVVEALFGGSMRGLANDTLSAGMVGPFSFDGAFRRTWVSWRRNVAGAWLMPVNFYQYVDFSGTDVGGWKILKLVYHDQIFPDTSSFLAAFNNGTLSPPPPSAPPPAPSPPAPSLPPTSPDYTWAQRKRTGLNREADDIPGPRSVSFSGVRYRVDRERRYVSWMGWGMFLGFDRDMGLGLWDVRFRGERIVYQLAPQEAIAQYGGSDPAQATTAWLDRYFGMGQRVRSMVPQYDCPPEALYLPAHTHSALGTLRVPRAVCVFEMDTGRPMSRHAGDGEGEFGVVKSFVLTVRSVSTVGNYDYYGTIEVRLSASGYMQGGYWRPDKDPYGGRIHDVSMGNLHDHVINYKVDLDIAGTSNSLLKTTTQVEKVTYPWLDDDWGREHIQQRIVREYITNESDALLKHPPNFQGGYALVNRDAKNAWGYPRGYAIHPGQSSIHNTVVGSKRLLNNANWARYNLAVSRRKETEPSSSSMWNLHLPGAPMVDFHKFFDGENITQEDLVAWVNVGMHHLPQAEDSPNTKTNIATSSFILTPLNYFDYDVSMELQNAILLHDPPNPGEPYQYDDYGVKQDITCLPEAPSPFEYEATQWLKDEEGVVRAMTPGNIREPADMYLRFRLGE